MNEHDVYTPKQHAIAVIREYITIFIVLCPFAAMVNWIFVPHNVAGGGLTGICSIIYYATQGAFPALFPVFNGAIPIWLTTLVFNAILLVIAGLTVGWRFCIRTVWGVICLAFWYRMIPIREEPLVTEPLLGCIVGGVLFGICLGIVILNNGSSGGTDIIAMIVNHYKDVSLGKVMVICDSIIILSSFFLPIPEYQMANVTNILDFKFKRIMCGIAMTVSYTAAVDWIINRVRQSVQFFIFSAKSAEIATAINQTAHRGVTMLNGMGWYSKKNIEVVTVLARKHEASYIMQMVSNIDPNAFISYAAVSGVFGQGFDTIKKKK